MFMLADLKRMATEDGWQRRMMVVMGDGERKPVTFDEYDPSGMTPVGHFYEKCSV